MNTDQLHYARKIKLYLSFPCPYCNDIISPLEFQSHCRIRHKFDSWNKCIWCLGKVYWQGKQSKHHVPNCIENFTAQVYRTNLKTYCLRYELQNMLVRPDEHPIPLPPFEWIPHPSILQKVPPLQQKRLQMAVIVIQAFLVLGVTVNWYHVITERGQATDIHSEITYIPFFCICGSDHRHSILYVPRQSFKPLRHWQPIHSIMGLIDLLGHISNANIPCTYKGNIIKTKQVNISLPAGYNIICALQWVGGIMELIHEWYSRVDPSTLLPVVQSFNGLWGVRVKDLPDIPQRCVLPVEKYLEPSQENGDFYLELTKGKKIFFSHNPELKKMTENEWIEFQAKKGNSIFEIIQDEIFYPDLTQQKCIRLAKSFSNKLASKEMECDLLKKKLNTIETTLRDLQLKCSKTKTEEL